MKTKLNTYTARKIEVFMCDAVFSMRDWREGNTSVEIGTNEATRTPCARVYLHGNHIATLTQVRHDALELTVMRDMLARYPTTTTQSRLRALGANVYQKAHVVYLNDEAVT